MLEFLDVILDVLCSFYAGTHCHFMVLLMYVGDVF